MTREVLTGFLARLEEFEAALAGYEQERQHCHAADDRRARERGGGGEAARPAARAARDSEEKGVDEQGRRWRGGSAAGAGFAVFHGQWPTSQLYGSTICRGPAAGRRIALTYDDGPNPSTPRS